MKQRAALPRFGAHLSTAGGLATAFDRAVETGCDCLQVFVKNQRQWQAKPPSGAEVAAWRDAAERTGVGPVVAHASYLINLASPDDAVWKKSIAAYVDELRRCAALRIGGLVFHPGAHLDSGESAACRRVAVAAREILAEPLDAPVRPLIEVTAGQGSCIGHRFEHIGEIIVAAGDDPRIGVCFDTCHALAAGYRFDDAECYAETFGAFDRHIGLDRLACFHLNDSVKPLGSRVDRHTHIGAGHVGRDAFRLIVNDTRFAALPMILETPKGTDDKGRDHDKQNLAKLRRMVSS